MVELYLQTDILTCLQQIAINLLDAEHWFRDEQTEADLSKLFSVAMRPAAVIHQLLCVRCAGFPFRLFGLLLPELRNPDFAQSLLSAPACMLDDMSRQLLQQYDSSDSLCSSMDLHQTLAALALSIQSTTFSTERLHSGNARRARGRTHTNLPPIEAVALAHAAHTGPSFLKPPPPPQSKPKGQGKRGRPPTGQPAGSEGQPKKRRRRASDGARRGGGGAWRAYVHHQVHHLKQSADFSRLAREYHALSQEDLAWYRNLGRQGSASRMIPLEQTPHQLPELVCVNKFAGRAATYMTL